MWWTEMVSFATSAAAPAGAGGGGWCVCVSGGTLGERGQDQENMDTAELGASLRLQGADAGPSGEGAAGGRPFRCPNQPLSPAPPGPAPALLP